MKSLYPLTHRRHHGSSHEAGLQGCQACGWQAGWAGGECGQGAVRQVFLHRWQGGQLRGCTRIIRCAGGCCRRSGSSRGCQSCSIGTRHNPIAAAARGLQKQRAVGLGRAAVRGSRETLNIAIIVAASATVTICAVRHARRRRNERIKSTLLAAIHRRRRRLCALAATAANQEHCCGSSHCI